MKGKILVVDDDETTRRTLAEILRLEHYQVNTVGSGESALDLLSSEEYDLMLLDLRMPEMDGVEVMQNAAKLSPETEIILLTAHGSLESAIEGIRHAVHDYLLKPIAPQELLGSIATGIARRAEKKRKHLLLSQMERSLQQLKEAEKVDSTTSTEPRSVLIKDGVVVDLSRREVWQGNVRVKLTPTEGKLLRVMLENRARVIAHKELVLMVQGYEVSEWEAPEVLRPLISRIRRKLAAFGGENWITNVRGTGYVFDEGEISRNQSEK